MSGVEKDEKMKKGFKKKYLDVTQIFEPDWKHKFLPMARFTQIWAPDSSFTL